MSAAHYVLILGTCFLSAFAVLALFLGLGTSALDRMVDPSFNLRSGKRFRELAYVYFILSMAVIYADGIFVEYFSVQNLLGSAEFRLVIPAIIFIVARTLTRCYSLRVAKHFLLSFLLIILVSGTTLVATLVLMGVSIKATLTSVVVPWDELSMICISALIIPFLTDLMLFSGLEHMPFLKKWLIKDKKLIDLLGKLPVTITTVVGNKNINQKITDLIRNSKNCLFILTHKYTTVKENDVHIKSFLKNGGQLLRIIGCPPLQDSEAANRLKYLREDQGYHICIRPYEKMRIIISDETRVMISYGTASYEGSHVGIYSDHTAAVSLFTSYFRTLCSSCFPDRDEMCDKRCTLNSTERPPTAPPGHFG